MWLNADLTERPLTSACFILQTLGRGPRSASTLHYGHILVTLMHDVLTPAENALIRNNQSEAALPHPPAVPRYDGG